MKKLIVSFLTILIITWAATPVMAMTLQRIWTMQSSVTATCYNPSGTRLMVGTDLGQLRKIDVSYYDCAYWGKVYTDAKNMSLYPQDTNDFNRLGGRINNITFSGDGTYMAVSSADGNVGIYQGAWDVVLHVLHTDHDPLCAVFNSSGSKLLVSCDDGTIQVWNTKTGAKISEINLGKTCYKADFYQGDAKVVAGLYDLGGTVVVANLTNGMVEKAFPAHSFGICDMALSPAANIVVTTGYDAKIAVRDYSTLTLLRTVDTYLAQINWLELSSDRAKILAGFSDGSLIIFKTSDLTELDRRQDGRQTNSELLALAVREQGSFFAAGYADGSIAIYAY